VRRDRRPRAIANETARAIDAVSPAWRRTQMLATVARL